LTDTLGAASGRFLCTRAHASELDSIRVMSGIADTVIDIYVSHPSDSLFAFPNPFGFNRDRTQICYYLPNSQPITVTIYDPFGNEVRSWRFNPGDQGARAGDNFVFWDGRNTQGRRVANGIYVIKVIGEVHTGISFKSSYRVGVIW
jgi:hypothetical protein